MSVVVFYPQALHNLTDQAIAHRLHIRLRAVENHIQHLKVKSGIDEVEQKHINSRVIPFH
ncbi:hypothetical protein [Fortiea contorta]|uniref:hypothetical protein n=1 Tax=Fortiea contorta TaxID=1892405 RepID=UPI00034AA7BF|nr:hypothetical protein [Fortiea contorta]